MTAESVHASELAAIVSELERNRERPELHQQLHEFVGQLPPADLLALAAPYRDNPDVAAPFYERVVAARPDDAQAHVILANAYWLQGRGPEAVGELADKAIALDPANRGAWHLWALSESNPRLRAQRWEQVSDRFPNDLLALAAFADNAAAVAGAEHDYEMLDVAIATFERLRARSSEVPQREAIDQALTALRGWRF